MNSYENNNDFVLKIYSTLAFLRSTFQKIYFFQSIFKIRGNWVKNVSKQWFLYENNQFSQNSDVVTNILHVRIQTLLSFHPKIDVFNKIDSNLLYGLTTNIVMTVNWELEIGIQFKTMSPRILQLLVC